MSRRILLLAVDYASPPLWITNEDHQRLIAIPISHFPFGRQLRKDLEAWTLDYHRFLEMPTTVDRSAREELAERGQELSTRIDEFVGPEIDVVFDANDLIHHGSENP